MNLIKLYSLLKIEATTQTQMARIPEIFSIMDESDNANAFHEAGNTGGTLEPIYFLNAKAVSLRVPKNGIVLDLGCGSGQFVVALAKFRPDLKIIGIELSDSMIDLANKVILKEGLSSRVQIQKMDMTKIIPQDYSKIDLVVSIFSYHHLPTFDLARTMITSVKSIMAFHGCSFWLFDHSRTKTEIGSRLFPEAVSPDESLLLKLDSTNSVAASFTYEELKELLIPLNQYKISSVKARLLPFYQCHWVDSRRLKYSVVERPNEFSFLNRIKGYVFAVIFGFTKEIR